MTLDFIGRKQELQTLSTFYQSEQAGLLILYGRRRIGKTRLMTHFLEEHNEAHTMYWMATTHTEAHQLRDFSQALLQHDTRIDTSPFPDNFVFRSWEAALDYLGSIVSQSKQVQMIVLDEFTYLLRNQPAISSIFQKAWDHTLSKIPQLKLVLTGSLLGMMARQVFSYQAPLYGRATALIHLRPLPFSALSEMFPKHTAAERVAIYGVTGGIPAYLELFTRAPTFGVALRDHGLVQGSMFLSDPAVILYEQLQEPQTYESILSTVAAGFHQWSDIARMAGISESSLGHYLKVLQELELIEKRTPLLAKSRTKQGRYYLRDPFLRFYYRFIVPQLGIIERGFQKAAVAKIQAELRPFLGEHVFESLCREWVWAAAMQGELAFVPEQVGSYWRTRSQKVQLDVVAALPRERKLFIGEAKWGTGLVRRHILTDLLTRSQRMPEVAAGWQTTYALFAREGFTEATVAQANEDDVMLINLTQLEAMLQHMP